MIQKLQNIFEIFNSFDRVIDSVKNQKTEKEVDVMLQNKGSSYLHTKNKRH